MKFIKGGWVLDSLAPNMLIGNDFLKPYEANIDYSTSSITLGKIEDFAIPFTVDPKTTACKRKVKTTRKITLAPGQRVSVPVDYHPLPNDRSFAFMATHDAAMHAVVDAKTPKIVVVQNTTQGTLQVPKGARIGTITESTDSGYFATSWKSAFKALAVGAAALALSAAPRAKAVPPTSPLAEATDVALNAASQAVMEHFPAVNTEFKLTNLVTAIATRKVDHSVPQAVPPTPFPNYKLPLSDQVFNIVEQSSTILETSLPKPLVDPLSGDIVDDLLPKPKYSEKLSNFGIKTPENLPKRVIDNGIHIYALDPKLADSFEKLVRAHPKLWVNEGLVKMYEDEMMKIPLVEGWENQKIANRSYPLSKKDLKVVDKVFDDLHDQSKMEWVNEATPFGAPFFVVHRTVAGEPKGRVVIDLRGLNRVTVPDNYPLPLQSEVIASLRGKKFITVIDAASFFYQFGVYPPHRDRFTVISPRGLERSTVALMGFRNPPAYTQRYMDRLLLKHPYCRAFIDDIVIYSDMKGDHLQHLATIFSLFQSKNLSTAPKKSFIGYPGVELLGFRVDGLGLTTTIERVAAFKNLAFPSTLKALEQYIGMTGFIRHLIPYYAQLAEPLQQRKVNLLAEGR